MIPEQVPTWSVIDGSKLTHFMACPRKFFYEYILGWKPISPNHNLHFGMSFHLALEHIYDKWKKRGISGYLEGDLPEAFDIFLTEYRKKFPPEDDTSHGYKSPENVLRILAQYQDHYFDDNFEVIETEISGCVPIGTRSDGSEKEIYFRLDTVVKNKGKYDILEHKTSTWRTDPWAASWPLSVQAGTGVHVLNCVYPMEEVKGITYNGFFFRAQPRFKKNGEPYANSGSGNEFLRVPIYVGDERMEWWLGMVNNWYDEVENEMDVLSNETEDQNVMKSFPCSTGACFDYGTQCAYYDLCCTNANPLQHVGQMPAEFAVEHWDPRDADTDHVKVIDV